MTSVTRISTAGMAPIYFLPCSRVLLVSWGLCAHTYAIPLLVNHTLALSFLVISSLITFLSACTISTCQIPGSPTLCPLHFTGTYPIISWTPYLAISLWCCHPSLHPQVVTQSLVTFTIASVCDSVPLYPYHTTGLWLSFLSACLFVYYYLQPGLCSFLLPI